MRETFIPLFPSLTYSIVFCSLVILKAGFKGEDMKREDMEDKTLKQILLDKEIKWRSKSPPPRRPRCGGYTASLFRVLAALISNQLIEVRSLLWVAGASNVTGAGKAIPLLLQQKRPCTENTQHSNEELATLT